MLAALRITAVIFLLLVGSAFAQQEPIDCGDRELGPSTTAVCDFLSRIDKGTILRKFSVEGASSETYSKKEFVEELIGGISVERLVELDEGLWGYAHLSFASRAICSLDEGRVTECIGSIPQRNNSASCRREYVTHEGELGSAVLFLICPVVTGWGTGFVQGGEIYLIPGDPFTYVGYFPTFSQADLPTLNIDYQTESTDRLGPSDDSLATYLDRCIEIKLVIGVTTRCEKYEISKTGAVASLQGTSSFNRELSDAYRSLIDAKR